MSNPYMEILLSAHMEHLQKNLSMKNMYAHVDKEICNQITRHGFVGTGAYIFGMKIIYHPEYEFCKCVVNNTEIMHA